MNHAKTLGELKATDYRALPVREEMRLNLMRKLQAPENAPYGMHVGTEWTGAQLYADDQLLMTAHADLETAKSHTQAITL